MQNGIEIPYSESRNISIDFLTRSFDGKDVYYQYSVSKDSGDNWQDIKGQQINLVQPGYGTYEIKVRAKTISSGWGDSINYKLHIQKPFWATWWFILSCMLAGLLITAFIIRQRIKFIVAKNKREHENELKFIKSEYKALNALMNPHFIFNTLNNVQSLFNGNDKEAANEYLRIFADLIRQNMQNVSKDLISLQKEMALVMNYLMLEKLRFEEKLNYEFNIDEEIDLTEIMIPPLLIQPLVENSIKHGILTQNAPGGTIQINICMRENILSIAIKDNGPGIEALKNAIPGKEEKHESFGLENIKRRIQQLSIIQNKNISLHFGDEKDSKGNHTWTVVTITIVI